VHGLIVKFAVRTTESALAVIVATVVDATEEVPIVNAAVLAPAGTTTFPPEGTRADTLLLDSDTT
jgi:hypothetical protein